MGVELLRELATRLGDAWQDAWLAQIASVRHDLLPVALSDDPADGDARTFDAKARRRRGAQRRRGE